MDSKNRSGGSNNSAYHPETPMQIEMDVENRDNEGVLALPKTTDETEKGPTLNQLLEVVQQLGQTQEKQGKEIKKLKRSWNTVKYIFRNEWKEKTDEWKAKKLALRESRKEEAHLERTLETLKESVREIGGKEDEIRKLKEMIAKLEEARKLPAPNATEGHEKEVSNLERKDALAILPEEMWRRILGNISDPNDLWNCYNTCPIFEGLLHDWKTSWVFEQTLPYFYRYLPGQALLKCRTICSGWLNVVDNLLGDHPSLRPYSDSPGPDPRRLEFINPLKESGVGWRNVFTFSNDGNVPLDPDIPDFPCKNVFMGRNVIMNIGKEEGDEDGGGQQLWDRVNRFLATFGKDIWYLTVSFPHSGWEQFEGDMAKEKVIQLLTVDVFQLIPNLKKLTIEQIPDTSGVPIQPNYPPALKLETIDVVYEDDDPDPLILSLLTHYHTQLRRLHVNYSNWQDVCYLGWPHLSELHIPIEAGNLEVFPRFQFVIEGIPQLRKLGLKVTGDTIYEYASFLSVLHKVISTSRLTTLRLKLEFKMDEDAFDHLNEELEAKTDYNLFVSPTLKTIEMDHSKMWKWARSYNFLLRYFPVIDNLHVFRRRTKDEPREKFKSEIDLPLKYRFFYWSRSIYYKSGKEMVEINKYAYGGEMYKSNIWELFPRLKVFTFMWDVYTRRGYEAYLESIRTS